MNGLKTLDQLWQENGCKPGLKVKHDFIPDSYPIKVKCFTVMGKAPNGYYGFSDEGYPCGPNAQNADKKIWQLYSEPEELVDHWPAIIKFQDGSRTTNGLYESLSEAVDTFDWKVIRLATELPPIKLPRRNH